jgi:type IV secretory pathway TraG/TraD family ATPase VirD4
MRHHRPHAHRILERRHRLDVAHSVELVRGIGPHLWGLLAPSVIGLAVGAVTGEILHRSRLRFTWTLLGIPIAILAWAVDLRLALLLSTATIVAFTFGVYRHLEALDRGDEEARERREAIGPLGLALATVARRRAQARRITEKGLAIGAARGGGVCRVPVGTDHGVHVLVAGATGSGKTVTQGVFTDAHVDIGFSAAIVDPKGDPRLYATAREAAERNGVPFRVWSPTGATVYNPLARGGPTEIADKALAAHEWSEPHYEMATRRLLGFVLQTMQAAGEWPPTLSAVVEFMDVERLDALATKVGGAQAERVAAYVDGLSARQVSDLSGGRDRLAVLVESELGPRLDPSLGAGESIDLGAALDGGEVVYFHLDADRYPAAAKLLASALLVDLIGLTADRRESDRGALLVIDEFAAVAAGNVSRLFARARAARLSLVLGTQSLADLRGARPDDPSDTLTEQVLSNIECGVFHRIGDPDSAERVARFAGTEPSWSTTAQVGAERPLFGRGEGTRTREREFLVGPDVFKRLRTGEAVVINPTAKRRAEIVRVWPARGGER